ncbi:MAG: hypothetical protein MJA27_31225 [Pseudanabaenales cyanobacterium]|nr:hypothetical protein [Pseudanabaenales cyanobacterium]
MDISPNGAFCLFEGDSELYDGLAHLSGGSVNRALHRSMWNWYLGIDALGSLFDLR